MKTVLGALGLLAVLGAGLRAAPADGFKTVTSGHFRVHHESAFAPAGVLNTLEELHAKLLLDLLPFAPWADRYVVDVYLYKDAPSYHAATGTPPWAGGHAVPAKRAIHVYEGDAFRRTMAHEMAHLFFEDFFVSKGARPPTWINEGVATVMEWDYGSPEMHAALGSAMTPEAFPALADFFRFDYHDGVPVNNDVSLWYLEAYSLTRYLMRRFSLGQFVTFCGALREGAPLDQALARAYALTIPDVPALDRLWRQSLGAP